MTPHSARGFVLPLVLLLLLSAGLLVGEALRGATVEQALVNSARSRQRAFESAEWGIADMEARLRAHADVPGDVNVSDPEGGRTQATSRLVLSDPLPPGFSANRVIAQRYRIVSLGRSGAARVEVESGLTRLEPAP